MATQQSMGEALPATHENASSTNAGNTFTVTFPSNYVEDITCTGRNGEEVHARLIVPLGNHPETAQDELGAFRLALGPKTERGLYFAARVREASGGSEYPVDSLLIFDREATPRDGDIVCALAFNKLKRDTLLQRVLFWLAVRSNRASQMIDTVGLRTQQTETTTYLLRRYVAMSGSYRLESIGGKKPSVQKSATTDIELLGVATGHRPWGAHRFRVMF